MYTQLRESLQGTPAASTARTDTPARTRVGRNVLCLGLTSFFTDISSEMVSAILPLYFVTFLRLSPLQFGAVDGLYQGVSALVRIGGGVAADRSGRHKEVATLGYALSALSKLGLLLVGGFWAALAALIVVDRTGKGIRTAPRDALISLSSRREELGTAFGVHRALDTAGAMVGPLIAFGLLALAPTAFDAVFVVSFCAAMLGLGILVLFVENRAGAPSDPAGPAVSLRSVLGLLAEPRFRALFLAGAALGLATISDGFVYLVLQRRLELSTGLFPLLYVATSSVYLVLAVPAGWLADRIGRGKVFVGGYALLLSVYGALLQPGLGTGGLVACVLLFGAYYAATDGVLMALASVVLPTGLRTSGLGLLTTATSLARLLASLLFGALWTWWGPETAVLLHLLGLAAALALTVVVLVRTAGEAHAPAA
ncbi:MAG TPA: MFS transporter [Chloroflexota bacterium]|jgi:MFS family permease|nr:MFS transporter [Chloroflexota bacterium]